MLSYLKTLYNTDNNDGDISIIAKDNNVIKCHSFVLNYASKTIKDILSTNNNTTITLDYNKNIIDILLHFTYSEEILEKELTIDEILSLFKLISYLNMNNFIQELKNFYIRQFPQKLTLDNWLHVLRSIYGIEIYHELFNSMIPFIKNNVLSNKSGITNITVDNLDAEIKTFLLKIALSKIIEIDENLQNILDERDNVLKKQMNNLIKNGDESDDNYSSEEEDDIDSKKISKINSKKKKKKLSK